MRKKVKCVLKKNNTRVQETGIENCWCKKFWDFDGKYWRNQSPPFCWGHPWEVRWAYLGEKEFQLFQFFILDNQNYSSLLEVEGALVQSSRTEKDCTRVDNNLSVISVVRTKESVRNIRTKESVRNILKWILLSLWEGISVWKQVT